MSQVETNPLVKTPSVSSNNNQVLLNVDGIVEKFNMMNPYMRVPRNFSSQIPDFSNLAQMEKLVSNFTWSTTQARDAEVYSLKIDIPFLKTIGSISAQFASFAEMSGLRINIRRTDNAFYAGLAMINFLPLPALNYADDAFNVPISAQTNFQLQKVFLCPKTAEDIYLFIPINWPFDFFPWKNDFSDYINLMQNYVFGYLQVIVISPLTTLSLRLNLSYRVSAQLLGLKVNQILS